MRDKYDLSISLITTAYNEEQYIEYSIRKWIKDLSALVTDYEIVFVDDGSTDKTYQLASDLAKEYTQIRLIRHSKNKGIGAATMTGVYGARKEYLFWDPVDMNFDTKYLPLLLDKLGEADIVIGCRPDRRFNSPYRKLTSYTNYWLIRLLSGLPIKDFQHVQIYPRKLFDEIKIHSTSTFIPPEIIIKAHKAGYSYVQLEVDYLGRKMGKSKCSSLRVIIRTIHDILKYFFWERFIN